MSYARLPRSGFVVVATRTDVSKHPLELHQLDHIVILVWVNSTIDAPDLSIADLLIQEVRSTKRFSTQRGGLGGNQHGVADVQAETILGPTPRRRTMPKQDKPQVVELIDLAEPWPKSGPKYPDSCRRKLDRVTDLVRSPRRLFRESGIDRVLLNCVESQPTCFAMAQNTESVVHRHRVTSR